MVSCIFLTLGLVAAFSGRLSKQMDSNRAASDEGPRCDAIRTWIVAATKVQYDCDAEIQYSPGGARK